MMIGMSHNLIQASTAQNRTEKLHSLSLRFQLISDFTLNFESGISSHLKIKSFATCKGANF